MDPDNKTIHRCIFCNKKAKEKWTILKDNGQTLEDEIWLCELHYMEQVSSLKKRQKHINSQL